MSYEFEMERWGYDGGINNDVIPTVAEEPYDEMIKFIRYLDSDAPLDRSYSLGEFRKKMKESVEFWLK